MEAKARPATPGDISELVRLYRLLELEMTQLHPMWSRADGLPEPIEQALGAAIAEADTLVYVGELEGAVLGFVLARSEDLLPQANDRVGAIRLVFTEHDAREVGLGAEMLETVLDELPGHRLAKNFFEAAGFSARSIVMHHNDDE